MGFFDKFKKKTNITNGNTSDSKDEIMKKVFQNIMQKAPSEHFASGAVFDIIRQNHEQFADVVNSNDALVLRNFFANAYITFCNQPQVVGFTPAIVDIRRNDTNPKTWNADIVMISEREKIALCFMPVNNSVFAARIIGIVVSDAGDRYYYCMLNKDENILSDVIRNKAMFGIEKIGSVKGLGFELMNSFVDCIRKSSFTI